MDAQTCSRSLALLLLLFVNVLTVAANNSSNTSPFWILIDGGSTGSRLHVFEWAKSSNNNNNVDIFRRGTFRTDGPLSALKDASAREIANHIMPALIKAAQEWIPARYYSSTRILYQATAGMRLLTLVEQELVYDKMYRGLLEHDDFPFIDNRQLRDNDNNDNDSITALLRSDLQTLSGELEGFYGAVAANYLSGVINAQLQFTNTSHPHPVGALDMGGSSTQIVFLPEHIHDLPVECINAIKEQQQHKVDGDFTVTTSSNIDIDNVTCPAPWDVSDRTTTITIDSDDDDDTANTLHDVDDFFATSYLSYGVDQFRERLWSLWVHEHLNERNNHHSQDECVSDLIENSCANVGWTTEWQGHTLVGTGQVQQCIKQVQRLIPHPHLPTNEITPPGTIAGVEHPPVRGHFLAMSMFFFALDCLRELGGKHSEQIQATWPNPTLNELEAALEGLCTRNWQDDLEHESHSFTRAEILPLRCLEATYIVTLLKDGYGFDPDARDITYTFTVDDNEVEWTLGMALVLKAQEQEVLAQQHDDTSNSNRRKNGTFDSNDDDENDMQKRPFYFTLWEELRVHGVGIFS